MQQKAAKDEIVPTARGRRQRFDAEPWYAEAARKMSAARKSSERPVVEEPAPPLAPD